VPHQASLLSVAATADAICCHSRCYRRQCPLHVAATDDATIDSAHCLLCVVALQLGGVLGKDGAGENVLIGVIDTG